MDTPTTTTASITSEEYKTQVAPNAFSKEVDWLTFPNVVALPIAVRGSGVPGALSRTWANVRASTFIAGVPGFYSITLYREPPDAVRTGLRARRTLSEGFMNVLAMKTGRRPSMAEQVQDTTLDERESRISLNQPVYRVSLLSTIIAAADLLSEAQLARQHIGSALRSLGLVPMTLYYIPDRALLCLQPGGHLLPDFIEAPKLFYDELQGMLPPLSRRVMPGRDSVMLGTHMHDGRDVYFSFSSSLDPEAQPPSHSITLILGEMGSGKTTLLRYFMLQRLLQGRAVFSIDPEGENNQLCEAVGGRSIPADAPQDPELCLLHPLDAEDPKDMLMAVHFLVAALAGEECLTPGTKAALHEAVARRWERSPGQMAIIDLVETLGTLSDPNASIPMALLRPYARGGILDGFFDRPRALLSADALSSQWLNFDLSKLNEANKAIVHAVLARFMYRIVTVGRIPLDIFIDEGWRLLRSGPFTDLLDELGRRARKRDTGVTLITHLPSDLAKCSTSLNLASTAFLGHMGPKEALAFFKTMGVPDEEAQLNAQRVSELPKYSFIAAPSGGRSALIPVRVAIPQIWLDLFERYKSPKKDA
jgi:hypothetical protein